MAFRMDKLTVKSQEAIQAAQSLAAEKGHADIDPLHLLAALAGETDGVARPVLEKIGVNIGQLSRIIEGELASVKVRGKERPERIFALIGDEAVEASDSFARLKGAHARLLAAVATGDAQGAKSALAECVELGGAPLARLYEHYQRQLERQPAGVGA